ncbi:hypothetical protein ACQW02_27600 [Humitalea sp. 24SJ18S-53]|uniref:hypothetical protein n=1 Tax=Humitalea sp. 24SJ18S-53 TaxID=3422307 RepID=UPI003D67E121
MRHRLACFFSVVLAALPGPGFAQTRGADRLAVIQNETGLTMREFFASPAGTGPDSTDRLGADTIPPGGTWRLRIARDLGCRFDLRGVFMDNSVLERRNIDLCNVTRVTFGDPNAPLREATLTNDTELLLRGLFVTPPGARDRGPDRLGAEVVLAGATWRLRLGRTRDCVFDVIAVFEDDSEERRDRADLCRTPRIGFGDPTIPRREVEVANDSPTSIQRVFAAPPGAARPGPDRLGAATLGPGESFRMTIRARECVIELRAEYEGGGAETLPAVDVCTTRQIAFDGSSLPRRAEQSVTLVNRHGAPFQEAYAAAADSDDWGPNRLDSAALDIGQRRLITLVAGCELDLRVVFPNGGAEERRAVDACAIPIVVVRPGWTIAEDLADGAGGDPAPTDPPSAGSIRLRNAGSLPIVEVFTGAPGSARGPDRLGAAILGAGDSFDIRPPPGSGCTADLVAVFRDGQEVARPALDLCAGLEVSLP